jgi:preprotein translocase subunit SecB
MADEITAQNGATDPNAPQFSPQVVYLKDVSFESPMGPRMPQSDAAPNVNMNLTTNIAQLGEDLFEVTLNVNVQSTVADKTLWLCEVKQAGAFAARNIPEGELRRILGVFCPNYLLPYSRQTIADLLIKGGFPPFLVPPVNFDALFDQATAQQNANTDAANQPAIN